MAGNQRKSAINSMLVRLFVLTVSIICLFGVQLAMADYDGVATRIDALASKFPSGKYWNHKIANAQDMVDVQGWWWEVHADDTTDHACNSHSEPIYVGYYDCNAFDGGIQCYGFASKCYYDVFGVRCTDTTNTTTHYDKWAITAGDHVRIGEHSVFVKSRNGNVLTLIECNNLTPGYGGYCNIHWGRTIDIANISVAWVKHANNWDEINRTHSTSATLDVNFYLDNRDIVDISGIGSFSITVGGTKYTGRTDYCESVAVGTSYSIGDIKAATGYIYAGIAEGSQSGSVASGGTAIRLRFTTCTSHSWNGGAVTKQPTCTSTGVRTYTCTKCGRTKTESIGMLAHTPVTDPAVAPTVTATGLTEGSHCSVCGTVLTAQQVVDKLPRVLYDFDLDGTAEPVVKVPVGVTEIAEETFAGSAAQVILLPEGVTKIGSRAFADMSNLRVVFWPESVKTVTFDLFDGSPNAKLYVTKGSRWGTRLDVEFVEIDTGWVVEDQVPAGAVITQSQWTYDYVATGTKTSYAPINEDGWTLTGTSWEKTGSETRKRVDSYPGGYTGSKSYTTDRWTSSGGGTNDTEKVDVSSGTVSYIYWHWCFNKDPLPNGDYNVYISDTPYETDSAGRHYQYFSSFESSTDAPHTDPNGKNQENGVIKDTSISYVWNGDAAQGSWWWYRIPVMQQTRTTYRKVYTYSQNINETRTSDTEVVESDTIKNVRHVVKYDFR